MSCGALGIQQPRRPELPTLACTALPASIPRPLGNDDLPSQPSSSSSSSGEYLKPLPRAVENVADDPSLHNPLQRMERLGTGWMGVITELEGVIVEDTSDVVQRAWLELAQQEGKNAPLAWVLKRADGMKAEQAIQEVLCWSRNPVEVRRMAARHETVYQELLGDRKPVVMAGVHKLLDTLHKHNVPVALVSTAPEARVHRILSETGVANEFETVVCAEDVYRGRPDPEGFLYASQRISRPPARCVVVGNSNNSIEAAREVGMQCVTVAGRTPVYELSAADLVVRQLEELSFVNLKQLFRMEDTVLPQSLEDEQMEFEEEEEVSSSYSTSTAVMER